MNRVRGKMRLLFLTLTAIVLLSCSGDGDRSTTPSPPVFTSNNFYATSGVRASFRTFGGTENIYVVRLDGFVANTSHISLSNARVMVQIFNSDQEQIGVKLATCQPTRIDPGTSVNPTFASYSVEFSPIHNPFYVTSLRVTPYSDRGVGFASFPTFNWPQ